MKRCRLSTKSIRKKHTRTEEGTEKEEEQKPQDKELDIMKQGERTSADVQMSLDQWMDVVIVYLNVHVCMIDFQFVDSMHGLFAF